MLIRILNTRLMQLPDRGRESKYGSRSPLWCNGLLPLEPNNLIPILCSGKHEFRVMSNFLRCYKPNMNPISLSPINCFLLILFSGASHYNQSCQEMNPPIFANGTTQGWKLT